MRKAFSGSSPACIRRNWHRPGSGSVFKRRERHDVSLYCPENALNADAFGHNPKRPSCHENTGCHFHSCAAHHYGSGLYRPAFDQRSRNHSTGELSGVFEVAFYLGDEGDAFRGSSFEAYQRTGGRCGVLDRIADFGGGKRNDAGRIHQRVARSSKRSGLRPTPPAMTVDAWWRHRRLQWRKPLCEP